MTADPAGAAEPDTVPRTEDGWQRLDPRNRQVAALFLAGPPVAVGVIWLAGHAWVPPGLLWTLASLGVTGMVIGAVTLMEWVTVRYRVTDERLQVRTGIAVRNHTSIPRDRIRSVDVSASPLHRAFRLATVKIGTGQHAGSGAEELKLDGVSPAEADRLRAVLLYRAAPAGASREPVREDAPIARLDWAWLRYAPLTMSSLLAVFGALGVLYKPLDALGLGPRDIVRLGIVRGAVGEFHTVPLWLSVTVIVLVVVVVAVLGALLIFVLTWWGFRLDDEGTTLRTRRGLLTTRSVTLEKRRMRGVEIAEPLLLRAGGGARVSAVAVGLKSGGDRRRESDAETRALLPPAPRAAAHRVATRVLGEDPTAAVTLRRHPRRALRRRINRAVGVALAVAVVLAILAIWWIPAWTVACALVLVPVLLPFSFDAYRSLGHGVAGAYLVTRYGTGVRKTVGLRRDGVIGWKITRSPFQRRAGLVTLVATTAANDGAYRVRDVAPGTALGAAEEAVPGLLAPFLAEDS